MSTGNSSPWVLATIVLVILAVIGAGMLMPKEPPPKTPEQIKAEEDKRQAEREERYRKTGSAVGEFFKGMVGR
jgi:hypothetical protein